MASGGVVSPSGLYLDQPVDKTGRGSELLQWTRHGRAVYLKEGKYTLNWTRLSCHKFVANQARLQLFVLAYNLGNFLRRLALPKVVKEWSLRSLQMKLIKTGAKLVHHARRLVFQLAEVAVSKEVFAAVLERIERLRCAYVRRANPVVA